VGTAGGALSARPASTYVAPFLLLVLFAPLEGRPELRSFYPWLVVGKACALSVVLAEVGRRLRATTARASPASALLGVVGALFWLGVVAALPSGRIDGDRPAFDPFGEIDVAFTRAAFLVARGLTLVVLVPVAEELFWRSFLPRYLDRREFDSIPEGRASLLGLSVSCVLYAGTHPEWLAALVYAACLCGWLRRTGRLSDLIVAHGVTNLLLGGYVLATGEWWLW